MTNFERITPAVGRGLNAMLFILSGLSKLAAPAATIGYIASTHLPLPVAGFGIAVAVELGGGSFLLLGYKTRVVAFVMALFTLATAAIFHNNFADQNTLIHFLKNFAIIGGLLNVAVIGGRSLSLDARLEKITHPLGLVGAKVSSAH